MTYKVNFTESNNAQKPAITVADMSLNKQTSVTFVGKNYSGYAPIVAENFLHLLENFANSSAPTSPIQGQVWFDNTSGVNQLKVFDGSSWIPAGVVVKSATQPLPPNAIGDLWVDTNNQQLYIFGGTTWLLIGPQIAGGSNTGVIPQVILDSTDIERSVISLFADNDQVAIISGVSFTPKSGISGFPLINRGITLNSSTFEGSGNVFTGTASRAEALSINGGTVYGSSFMRNDQPSTTTYPIIVDNDSGITVGASNNLVIGAIGSSSFIYSAISSSTLDLKVNNAGTSLTALSVSATGQITLSGSATSSIIIPDTTDSYDLGSSTRKFRNVYATSFVGAFSGSVSGTADRALTADYATTAGSATTATTATTATSATTAATATVASRIENAAGWNVTPNGTNLYISFNGVNLAKLDSNGNLTVKGTVTPSGTIS